MKILYTILIVCMALVTTIAARDYSIAKQEQNPAKEVKTVYNAYYGDIVVREWSDGKIGIAKTHGRGTWVVGDKQMWSVVCDDIKSRLAKRIPPTRRWCACKNGHYTTLMCPPECEFRNRCLVCREPLEPAEMPVMPVMLPPQEKPGGAK